MQGFGIGAAGLRVLNIDVVQSAGCRVLHAALSAKDEAQARKVQYVRGQRPLADSIVSVNLKTRTRKRFGGFVS